MTHRCDQAVDEEDRGHDPGQHPQRGPEQEVAPADVRRSGDDVDDGERRDRYDAHENHGQQPALGEAARDRVEALAGEPAHGLTPELAADAVGHDAAQHRAGKRVDAADERAEDNAGDRDDEHHRDDQQAGKHVRAEHDQRREWHLLDAVANIDQ